MNDKVFTNGPYTHLNACVGQNTSGDDGYGYVLGFAQAAEVLIAAAKQQSYSDPDLPEESIPVFMDVLIYPIVFCARHHIELFLKRQIFQISAIRGNDPEEMVGTHDLNALLTKLKELCQERDRRLMGFFQPLENIINEFASIDPTGETFRYQCSRDNRMHLENTSVINLMSLGNEFKRLSEGNETFEEVVSYICREYRQGTFTNKLSRQEIEELAKALPPRNLWKESKEKFNTIKNQFIEKYGLSKRDISKAIKLIESHYEFSAIIGIEIPLETVSPEIFEKIQKTPASITLQEWIPIRAITEVGRLEIYSERYKSYSEYWFLNCNKVILPLCFLEEFTRKENIFRKGLKKLGQKSLLEALNKVFPESPKRSDASFQKASEELDSFLYGSKPITD